LSGAHLVQHRLKSELADKVVGTVGWDNAEDPHTLLAPVGAADALQERLPIRRRSPEHDQVNVADVYPELEGVGGNAHCRSLTKERRLNALSLCPTER